MHTGKATFSMGGMRMSQRPPLENALFDGKSMINYVKGTWKHRDNPAAFTRNKTKSRMGLSYLEDQLQIAKIDMLNELGDTITRHIEIERQAVIQLEEEILNLHGKKDKLLKKTGDPQSSPDSDKAINKQLQVLANNIARENMRASCSSNDNQQIKSLVTAGRRQRIIHRSVFQNLQKKIHSIRDSMSKIVCDSNVAFEERAAIHSEIKQLNYAADDDRLNFVKEWSELEEKIAASANILSVMDSMNGTAALKPGGLTSTTDRLITEAGKKLKSEFSKSNWKVLRRRSQIEGARERERIYSKCWKEVKEDTKVKTFSGLIKDYVDMERRQISRISFINDLNSQLAILRADAQQIAVQTDQHKKTSATRDNKRHTIVDYLESQHYANEKEVTEAVADKNASNRVLKKFMEAIYQIYQRLECKNTFCLDIFEDEDTFEKMSINEKNMMQMLGIVQHRIGELLRAFSAIASNLRQYSHATRKRVGTGKCENLSKQIGHVALAAPLPSITNNEIDAVQMQIEYTPNIIHSTEPLEPKQNMCKGKLERSTHTSRIKIFKDVPRPLTRNEIIAHVLDYA